VVFLFFNKPANFYGSRTLHKKECFKMKKYLILIAVLSLTCLLFVSGCGTAEEAVDTVPEPETEESAEPVGPIGTVIVTDQMGREVVIESVPQRIISLSPSNTEVAFALGLGDRLVGVTEYCNYPAEALEKEIIGGFATPSIEKIVELEPDLVLASTIHVEDVPRLEALGIPVLVVESATLVELYTSMSLIAEVTAVTAAGEELIASMQQRISAVEEVVSSIPVEDRILVYYEVYSDPLMSAGKDAFINEIITLAGGINIFGDISESYPQISAEVVAERQPEIILYPDYHGTADMVSEAMAGRPGWESVPAVVNGQVFSISDDSFARPGPRVVEAVEEAVRLFYPQLF
jgi:iron complex transport system substrate-binding protein